MKGYMYNTLGITGFHRFANDPESIASTRYGSPEGDAAMQLERANGDLSLTPDEYEYWYGYASGIDPGSVAHVMTPQSYKAFLGVIVQNITFMDDANALKNVPANQYADTYALLQSYGVLKDTWRHPADYVVSQGEHVDTEAGLRTESPIIPSPNVDIASGGDVVAGAAGGLSAGVLLTLAAIGCYLLFGKKSRD